MTTYGAYDAGLPCKNPSCKSHGTPHPNCQCYPNLAEGGEVSFCAKDRAHQPECEYFASGGGIISPELVPPNDGMAPVPQATQATPETQSDPITPDSEAASAPQGEIIPDSEIVPDSEQDASQEITPDSERSNEEKFGTTSQQIMTGIEGAAQGYVPFSIGTLAEKGLSKLGVPGLSDEEIRGRREANPEIYDASEAAGLAAGFFTGTGEVALASKIGRAVGDLSLVGRLPVVGKVGSAIIREGVASSVIQGWDEESKWLLGQGDQSHAAGSAMANMKAAGLIGMIAGAAGGVTTSAAEAAAATKFGHGILSWLEGVSTAAAGAEPEFRKTAETAFKGIKNSSLEKFRNGMNFYDKWINRLAFTSVVGAAAKGYQQDGMLGAIKDVGYLLGGAYALKKGVAKVIGPTIIKVAAGDPDIGSYKVLKYARDVSAGSDKINHYLEKAFSLGGITGQQMFDKLPSDEEKKQLDDCIKEGGIMQCVKQQVYEDNAVEPSQGFAEGGEVLKTKAPLAPNKAVPILDTDGGLGRHYPEANVTMNAARGRISNYLSTLRPQADLQPRLAFDDKPETADQQRAYDKAMTIALQPLSVIQDIHKGTLEPDHVKHLSTMYPELTSLLQKRVTEKIIQAQLDGKKPTYKVRQGLSLLMGTPLSSDMTPQSIQAVQGVFAKNAQSQKPQSSQPPKKAGGSALAKADTAFLTGSQALQRRGQRTQ